jgi:hypothetical protein
MATVQELKISNCMHANVSGFFAFFINGRFRGPNWKWSDFPRFCEDNSDIWLWQTGSIRVNDKTKKLAKKYAGQMARHLLSNAGLDKEDKTVLLVTVIGSSE